LEDGCGPLRDAAALEASRSALENLRDELKGETDRSTFLSRAVLVARSIAAAAAARTESRGDHFRTDHPERDDRRWLGNLRVRLGDGPDLRLSFHRAGIGTREAAPLPRSVEDASKGSS
jgi:succinate dehydrogenase/fumarate reductase flavoprotein subunit